MQKDVLRYSDEGDLFPGEERRAVKKIGYPWKWVVYGDLYNCDQRTVQRWVQSGRDKGSPPPLGNPFRLKHWFETVLRKNAPQNVLEVCSRCDWVESIGEAVEPVVMELAESVREPVRQGALDIDTDIEAALGRIRHNEAYAGAQLEKVYKSGDALAVQNAQKAFDKAAETRAKYEGRYLESLKANGSLYDKASILKMVHEFHSPLLVKFKGFLKAWREECYAELTAEEEKKWEKRTESLFSELNSEFLAMGEVKNDA